MAKMDDAEALEKLEELLEEYDSAQDEVDRCQDDVDEASSRLRGAKEERARIQDAIDSLREEYGIVDV